MTASASRRSTWVWITSWRSLWTWARSATRSRNSSPRAGGVPQAFRVDRRHGVRRLDLLSRSARRRRTEVSSMNRKASFAALLGVVAVSIVFGMIVGGRLNAPRVMHAARETVSGGAFPAASGPGGIGVTAPDFSTIAEATIPAVVGVQNTSVNKNGGDDTEDDDPGGMQPFDGPMYKFFHPGPRQPQSERRVSSGS